MMSQTYRTQDLAHVQFRKFSLFSQQYAPEGFGGVQQAVQDHIYRGRTARQQFRQMIKVALMLRLKEDQT